MGRCTVRAVRVRALGAMVDQMRASLRGRSTVGLAALGVAVALFGAGASARGNLIITPTFNSTITSDANAVAIENAINQAILPYQNTFSDPINVQITFGTMTTGLGQSSTFFFNAVPYSTVVTALTASATSADDFTAIATVPAGPNNPLTGTSILNIKTANAHALGLGLNYAGTDSTITINTHITDIGSPGTTGQYSFRATVQHEIDEALGLGSALPSPAGNNPFPEDLFRYSAPGVRSFTTATSPQPYLSFDGGTTSLVQYNTVSGGDYGDYNGVGGPRVQDAFATPGASPVLGVELRALDVIGYTKAVPEPASLVSCVVIGAIALGRRGRRGGAIA